MLETLETFISRSFQELPPALPFWDLNFYDKMVREMAEQHARGHRMSKAGEREEVVHSYTWWRWPEAKEVC